MHRMCGYLNIFKTIVAAMLTTEVKVKWLRIYDEMNVSGIENKMWSIEYKTYHKTNES